MGVSRRALLLCSAVWIGAVAAGCTPSPTTIPDAAVAQIVLAGVTTRTFVDTTRPTPANGTAPALPSRTLVTEIWYPTAQAPDADSDPLRDAPPLHTATTAPLVLLVHGSSSSRNASNYLTQALAEAGYVVAAADFPLTALDTPGGASDLHCGDQRADLSFIADSLAALPASDPVAGVADTAGYAVVGHSTGGTISLLAAYAPDAHDARVRAVAALAPCACFFGTSFFTTRSIPLMVIAGSDDLLVPPSDNGARAYALAPAPKVFATLVGGNHLYFTGVDLTDALFDPMPTTMDADIATTLVQYGGGMACEPIPPPGTDAPMSFDDQHAHTIALVRAFLDDALRGRRAAIATLEAAHDPSVTIVAQ